MIVKHHCRSGQWWPYSMYAHEPQGPRPPAALELFFTGVQCAAKFSHWSHLHVLISRYTNTHAHTHTHPFNGPLSGTTRVSRYQKGNTNLDFTEARDSEWQWQVCTSLQTDNHAS